MNALVEFWVLSQIAGEMGIPVSTLYIVGGLLGFLILVALGVFFYSKSRN